MEGSEDVDIGRVRRLILPELAPGEEISDVLAAGVHLAQRRARLLGRAPTQQDLEFALSIICYWPIKTKPSDEVSSQLRRVRAIPVVEAGSGDFALLDSLVPDSTLTLDRQRLGRMQQRSVSSFLRA